MSETAHSLSRREREMVLKHKIACLSLWHEAIMTGCPVNYWSSKTAKECDKKVCVEMSDARKELRELCGNLAASEVTAV